MPGTVVCDASAVVALLVDGGPAGQWTADQLRGADLLAPHLVLFEAANILRRQESAARISADLAAQAHADLLDLPIELWPYELLAPRAWALRANLSTYDAAYVALAELAGATLVTLDRRLAGAPGIACPVAVPT
ncbi:MAG: type II toxin-antitoxin system VapC family toxin [Thermoanaerobacterales bacterium]|nr:PIN domain-containing protein [Thermoanaerobacterales bacterium]